MTIAPDDALQGGSRRYQAMRDFVQSMDYTTTAPSLRLEHSPATPHPRTTTLNAWQKRPAHFPSGPSSPFPLFGTGPPVS
nr:hypothetical protein [Streptomyces sp. S1D4-11]